MFRCQPQGARLGALVKHELQLHRFLHMLTWGHFWSVYGEGEDLGQEKGRKVCTEHCALCFHTAPGERSLVTGTSRFRAQAE